MRTQPLLPSLLGSEANSVYDNLDQTNLPLSINRPLQGSKTNTKKTQKMLSKCMHLSPNTHSSILIRVPNTTQTKSLETPKHIIAKHRSISQISLMQTFTIFNWEKMQKIFVVGRKKKTFHFRIHILD